MSLKLNYKKQHIGELEVQRCDISSELTALKKDCPWFKGDDISHIPR
jgi:hypothetical protein